MRPAKAKPRTAAPAKAASPGAAEPDAAEDVGRTDLTWSMPPSLADLVVDVEVIEVETIESEIIEVGAIEPDAEEDETVDEEEATAKAKPATAKAEADDFTWDDEEESEALKQARKDAELTASADSVRAYLKQIGKVALLNAEEEVDLAERIEAGLYAVERVRQSTEAGEKVTTQMRRDLNWIRRDGERAKNHLLEANLRLVVSLAKRYTGRGMAFLDLIQEGQPRA